MTGIPLLLLVAASAAPAPTPPPCSPAVIRNLAQAPDAGYVPHVLTCNLTLRRADVVRRPIALVGKPSSGVTINCNGATLGTDAPRSANAEPTLVIMSQWLGGKSRPWVRPSDIAVRNCRIHGQVMVGGKVSGTGAPSWKSQSRRAGFTRYAQSAAPTRITFDNIDFRGRDVIPLYVSRGSTEVSIMRSRFEGEAPLAIYMSYESARNRIVGNQFDIVTKREMIAVDGSAHNVISRNRFILRDEDAIRLYRNCGENGVIRHQTPSYNRITDNIFTRPKLSKARPYRENSRSNPGKKRGYCDLDKGFSFGSSIDDNDNGHDNIFTPNQVIVR